MSRRSERLAQEAAHQANEAAKTVKPEVSEAARVLASAKTEDEGTNKQVRPVVARNEAHTKAHEEIEKRYLQTLGVNEDGTPIEKTEEPKIEEAKAEEPQPEPKTEVQEAPVVEPEKKLVKQIVDGEEVEVSQDEIDEAGGPKAWRIAKAAENRLKKANDAIAQARKVQDELAQFAIQQIKAQQPQQPQITDDQFIAQKLDQIRYGTPEEGAVALREVLQKTQQRIDPNLMIAQATSQMRRQLAVDKFKDEFADIATNPDLLQFAAVMEQQTLSQVQPQALFNLDWNQHYRAIGNKIRSLVGKPNQPATATPTQGHTSQPSDKEARKASITVLPTAASPRVEVKVEKELTPEEARKEAIAEMQRQAARARGEKLA